MAGFPGGFGAISLPAQNPMAGGGGGAGAPDLQAILTRLQTLIPGLMGPAGGRPGMGPSPMLRPRPMAPMQPPNQAQPALPGIGPQQGQGPQSTTNIMQALTALRSMMGGMGQS